MYGCMDVWVYGQWMYGCMDVWMYGCMYIHIGTVYSEYIYTYTHMSSYTVDIYLHLQNKMHCISLLTI